MSTTSDQSAADEQPLVLALTALRNGDFTVRVPAGSEGAQVFNEFAEMLGVFDAEVRRIARELGTEGRFGPQAEVSGTHGEWTTLVGDINRMAANLTNQVRDIARVTASIANGDTTRRVTVGGEGEIASLKTTLNNYIDKLNGPTA